LRPNSHKTQKIPPREVILGKPRTQLILPANVQKCKKNSGMPKKEKDPFKVKNITTKTKETQRPIWKKNGYKIIRFSLKA